MEIAGLGDRQFSNEEAFIVRHFAADVCYQTHGWMSKNNDSIHSDLMLMMQKSKNSVVQQLFPEEGNMTAQEMAGRSHKGKKNTRFETLTSKFQTDLTSLMRLLGTTKSHFIRCINPNLQMVPGVLNRPGVITQLRCSGMLDALRIMQAGFPTRCLFTDLKER